MCVSAEINENELRILRARNYSFWGFFVLARKAVTSFALKSRESALTFHEPVA